MDDVTAAAIAPGDRVRVRTDAPDATPRTPAYVRGATGRVLLVHGRIPNPLDHREIHPPLYTVVFRAGELFPDAGDDEVAADLHADWLVPLADRTGG